VWSASRLDAFLADGQRLVPENRMVSPRVSDPRQRADLVFFLGLATRSR
jgi:cytochrome c2